MEGVIKASPEFITASAEKGMIDSLRRSQSSFDRKLQFSPGYIAVDTKNTSVLMNEPAYYQMIAIEQIGKGNTEKAFESINKSIVLEMSWLNYVLLGKIYEMKGENRMAADSYITAFNLTPGENTLYWIRNGVFQSSLEKIVPYLQNFPLNKRIR